MSQRANFIKLCLVSTTFIVIILSISYALITRDIGSTAIQAECRVNSTHIENDNQLIIKYNVLAGDQYRETTTITIDCNDCEKATEMYPNGRLQTCYYYPDVQIIKISSIDEVASAKRFVIGVGIFMFGSFIFSMYKK